MKRGVIILAFFAGGVLLIGILIALSAGGPRRDLEKTKEMLRREGYKTELAEFNFVTTPEMRARAAAFTPNRTIRSGPGINRLDFMAPVGTDTALVLWQLPELPSHNAEDGWPALRESLDEDRSSLDAAMNAILSGPLKFDMQAGKGSSMPLPHLAAMRNLAQSFAHRAVLELHDRGIAPGGAVHGFAFRDDKNDAWTNLLALTRLVTAWEPEPAEVSQLVRFNSADLAFKTTWQVLQAGGWDENRLLALQREWENVDFFKGLPEAMAFTRASMAAFYELARNRPLTSGFSLNLLIHEPRMASSVLPMTWQQLLYRHRGSYEAEKALLLFYRDRENEMRQGIQSPTWKEMRQLPAATNNLPFQPAGRGSAQRLAVFRTAGRRTVTPLSRAAEMETRRRLVITALALERFHNRHGSYPKTLAELSPELLPKVPDDFMDGQPLRYHRNDDGSFVLYSVGLDCTDDGGHFAPRINRRPGVTTLPGPRLGLESTAFLALYNTPYSQHGDLLWPRPASYNEVKAELDAEKHQEELRMAAEEAQMEEAENAADARRQAFVQELLAEIQAHTNAPPTSSNEASEPTYNFKPLSQLLRNDNVLGTNRATMTELLTLKQVITGQEPAKATFELPLKYDAVTNLGELRLLMDGQIHNTNESEEVFEYGEEQSCERATNGDCLLIWNTTYDAPGQHVIQAHFMLEGRDVRRPIFAAGPPMPYFSSNLCQFSQLYSHFEAGTATLYAKLAESNGIYSIEIQSPDGKHVRTFNGRTTNGVIKVRWDLTDDQGAKYTNDSFENIFDIKLPDSGRTQKIK